MSDADRAFLAMDRGPVPEHLGLAMVLNGQLDRGEVARFLARRVAGVPALCRRMSRTGAGVGPPAWVRPENFDAAEHLEVAACAEPGDEQAMVDAVLPYLLRPLPRDRPLWRAVLVTGLAGGRTALALVVHHAVVDGMGGLAVLARLLDGGDAGPAETRPPAVHQGDPASGGRLRRLRTAMAAGGGVFPARAEPCSLLGPTGPTRRAVTARVDLAALRASAHRHGATVNAALLVAVADALGRILEQRGERIGSLRVAVPVEGPRADPRSGNASSPLLVGVGVGGPAGPRMAAVTAQTRRDRRMAAGPAPIAVMGAVFRLFATLGGYQWYMRHQHRVHTVVTDLRGPAGPARFGGVAVSDMIPFVVGGATDITVSFQALSYAGTLTVTAIADPAHFPDPGLLARSLREGLAAVAISG